MMRVQKAPDQDRKRQDGKSWCRGPFLGEGGFASVYLATTKNPQSKLGSLPPQMAVKSAKYTASTILQNERKVLKNLHDFRHIIRCFGKEITHGRRGEKVYNLLLEYAAGGSLYDLIYDRKSCCGLPESDVKRYTRSILEGIKHVHDCGYAHLDIKPENILLVPSANTIYEAKLCDFGLAKKVKGSKKTKQSDHIRGTASYLSPEAVIEHIQGPPSDIWAVGCVVLEMLTAKKARVAPGVVKAMIPIYEAMIPRHLSQEATEFLESCFAMEVEDRPTAEKLLELPFLAPPTTGVVEPHQEKEKKLRRLWRKCRHTVLLMQAPQVTIVPRIK